MQVTRVVPETFVPPLPGHRGPPGRRRRARRGARPHRRRAPAAGRAHPRRRAGRPRPRLHRRHEGRPRQHLRHLRRGHEDELRHVPALLAVQLRRARRRGDEHQGPDLQRQGRGPAVPRPRQHPARRRRSAPATPCSAWRPAPFRSVRVLAPPRRGDPNGTPATGARTTGVRPLYWTIAEFCRQGLLPFLFADAEDERQQYTIVVQAVTAQLRQHARAGDTRDGAVRIDGTTVRTFRDLVARRRVQADARRPRRRRRPALERAGRRAGARSAPSCAGWRRPSATSSTSIRADLADAADALHRPRRPAGHRRRPAHAPRPGQALRRRRRAAPGVRRQGGHRHGASRCSSSCSTSSTSTRRGTRRARSRRSSSTSPSAAAASG